MTNTTLVGALNSMNTFTKIVATSSLAYFVSGSVHAEWYMGVDQVPTTHWYQIEDYLLGTSNFDLQESSVDSGFKLYSGYKAHDLFSLELEYKDQMEFGVGNVFSGRELWLSNDDSAKYENKALFFSGKSTYVIDENKRIHVQGGLYNWDLKPNGNYLDDDAVGGKRSGTDIFYSVGSYFNVTEKIGFSAEWERFEFENEDVDFISTELRFNF